MVGIVVVSHSARLAEGVVELAREMGGPEVAIEAAGGTDDPDAPLGTDATKVMTAIESADSGDGVLVLMDLGSAVLSAEMALEFLGGGPDRRVVLSDAPLIEGAVSAATAARLGSSLDEVAAEARGALAPKAAHLGTGDHETNSLTSEEPTGPSDAYAPTTDASVELAITNRLGLHARPAARFVQTAASFDADVRVSNLTTGTGPVHARSLNGIATLGARKGHRIRVTASGPQSHDAIEALRSLAAHGFGDRDEPDTPAPRERRGDAPAGGISGVAASPGIAIGPARHLVAGEIEISDHAAADADAEWGALMKAVDRAASEIEAMRREAATRLGESEAQIFDAHVLLLRDDDLLEPARSAILADKKNAGRAWRDAVDAIAARYEGLDDPYQAERAADVYDVGNRVLAHLFGVSTARSVSGPGVLLVDELAPADAAALDPKVTAGIVGVRGGATSHGAILARSLGIPAVVGVGVPVTQIAEGTTIIVDGHAGSIVVDPGPDQLAEFRARRDHELKIASQQRALAKEPARLADGTRIDVFGNAGGPADAARAVEVGAEGIGLLRTEFLFMERDEAPSEDEQYAALCDVAKKLGGRPVIVRTLDAGADKPMPFVPQSQEGNPFLGVRGIRLSLAHRDLFITQLRAIVRAAVEHPVKVMFPMVTNLDELDATLTAVHEASDGLRSEGIDVPADLEVGIMVEVPAVALTAELFAPRVSFFSIGTNDLTQYTVAADRGNEHVAPLADALHPSVLRLVDSVVRAAKKHDRWVGVCGEVAGDPGATALLVGLGVTELSMAPAAVPAVKHALRDTDIDAAGRLAAAALTAESADAVRRLVADRGAGSAGPQDQSK